LSRYLFVKNKKNQPLMPCKSQKARLLIRADKAKIINYKPFTIQLLIATGETVQPISLGIDTGAKYIGFAVTSGTKVFGKGTIELRDDVSKLLTTRRAYRRSRRNRKTRYRQPKFLNRNKSAGWLPPSVQSRVDHTVRWINKFSTVLPTPKIIVEVGKFDAAKLKNPDIKGKEYQNGDAFGFWDTRYYVFTRDNYICQICKKKEGILQTHHIIAPADRTKWSATLDVKPFEAGKTEYLFYIGCAGSFDSRSKHVTVAMTQILDAAGISWGILGKEEKCCGDSLRRLGNEYVFDKMARENVALFREKGVTKVITQCPHCFTTLKNDYRQYGLELEVMKLNRQVKDLGNIVFHDSCYLGRHNGIYDAPRTVIARATGSAPTEMERNRENSFCCGAGGGRMWLEEHQGERINLTRVREALEKAPDTICVTCPYCMTMIEDGLKDLKAAQVRVKDIAEVVAEGMCVE